MRMVWLMLDELVLSTLTQLPEIPVAQQQERACGAGCGAIATGSRRSRKIIEQVAARKRRRVQQATNGHGAHAEVR